MTTKRKKVQVLQVRYSDYTTKTIYDYDPQYIDDLFSTDIQKSPESAGHTLSAQTIEVIKKREEADSKRQNAFSRYKDLL